MESKKSLWGFLEIVMSFFLSWGVDINHVITFFKILLHSLNIYLVFPLLSTTTLNSGLYDFVFFCYCSVTE